MHDHCRRPTRANSPVGLTKVPHLDAFGAKRLNHVAWQHRLRNLTTQGRLSLEAPAYCVGARGRLSQGMDSAIVRERLGDDIRSAFEGRADSLVRDELRRACPELAR